MNDYYVLVHNRTEKYVARKGDTGSSYTRRLEDARIYQSREQAQLDRCPESERIVAVEQLLKGRP